MKRPPITVEQCLAIGNLAGKCARLRNDLAARGDRARDVHDLVAQAADLLERADIIALTDERYTLIEPLSPEPPKP